MRRTRSGLLVVCSLGLLTTAQSDCASHAVGKVIPRLNRRLEFVRRNLTKYDPILVSGNACEGQDVCINPEIGESLASKEPPGQSSWVNYADAVLFHLIAGLVLTAASLCLWPCCCCFLCRSCMSTTAPGYNDRRQEKLQVSCLLAFVLCVCLVILFAFTSGPTAAVEQVSLVDQPVDGLVSLVKELPAAGKEVVLGVAGALATTLLEVNETLEEHLQPLRLSRSFDCASDALDVAGALSSSMGRLVESLRRLLAELPGEPERVVVLKMLSALGDVQSTAVQLRSGLEEVASPLQDLAKACLELREGDAELRTSLDELASSLRRVKEDLGAYEALRREAASFKVEGSSEEEKEAHVRKLLSLLDAIAAPQSLRLHLQEMDETATSAGRHVKDFLSAFRPLVLQVQELPPALDGLRIPLQRAARALEALGPRHTSTAKKALAQTAGALRGLQSEAKPLALFEKKMAALRLNTACAVEGVAILREALIMFRGPGLLPRGVDLESVSVALERLELVAQEDLPKLQSVEDALRLVDGALPNLTGFQDFASQVDMDKLERQVHELRQAHNLEMVSNLLELLKELRESGDLKTLAEEAERGLSALQEDERLHPSAEEVKQMTSVPREQLRSLLGGVLASKQFSNLPFIHSAILQAGPDVSGLVAAVGEAEAVVKRFNTDAAAKQLWEAIAEVPNPKDQITALQHLEDLSKEVPDMQSLEGGMTVVLDQVGQLASQLDSFGQLVEPVNQHLQALPTEKINMAGRYVKVLVSATHDSATVNGSMANVVSNLERHKMQDLLAKEGFAGVLQLVRELVAAVYAYLEERDIEVDINSSSGLPPWWQDGVADYHSSVLDALGDKPTSRSHGHRPSHYGPFWYLLNVLSVGGRQDFVLLADEDVSTYGKKALLHGHVDDDGNVMDYLEDGQGMGICATKVCMQNTVKFLNSQEVGRPWQVRTPVTYGQMRPRMVCLLFLALLGLLSICAVLRGRKGKCPSCVLLLSVLVYLPVLSALASFMAPASMVIADTCHSLDSLAVANVQTAAPLLCSGAYDPETGLCRPASDLALQPEELTRSIVAACTGHGTQASGEAVEDLWRQLAAKASGPAAQASLRQLLPPQMPQPLELQATRLLQNASAATAAAIAALGETLDCHALGAVYGAIEDTLCCNIGATLVAFTGCLQLLAVATLCFAVPGAAAALRRSKEPLKRGEHSAIEMSPI